MALPVGRTLEEAFLDDFDLSGDEVEKPLDEDDIEGETGQEHVLKDLDIENVEVEDIDIDDLDDSDDDDDDRVKVTEVSNLLASEKLKKHMAALDKAQSDPIDNSEYVGNVQNEQDYELVVASNKMINEIDAHIFKIHKFIRELYATKFPELEEMVVRPLDYARVVRLIGNKNSEEMAEIPLRTILSGEVAMVVNVTASTSLGKPLPQNDLESVLEGVDHMLELEEHRQKIIAFVASRMSYIAPNTSALIGTDIAALLVGIAGGIKLLSQIPACNIQTLGSKKRMAGMMMPGVDPHFGVVAQCPLVRDAPRSMRQKVLRLVAAKVALAARVDANQSVVSSALGSKYFNECTKKIMKWMEPPPAKPPKALPAPDEKPRRKRGGKKYRKMRERYKVTETQRMQNRLSMSKPEEEVITLDGEMVGLGMLSRSAVVGGRLRMITKASEQSQLERENKRIIAKQRRARKRQHQKKGTASGLTTSLVFTAVQGMELGVADMQREAKKSRYF